MRNPAGILLSVQGLTLKNSWCCRQPASRTPCKQPTEDFGTLSASDCLPIPPVSPGLLTTTLSMTPLTLKPEVNAWSGVLANKTLKQTDNPQVRQINPKVKEQVKANSLFSFKAGLVFEHEKTTDPDWVPQIKNVWWVNDGTEMILHKTDHFYCYVLYTRQALSTLIKANAFAFGDTPITAIITLCRKLSENYESFAFSSRKGNLEMMALSDGNMDVSVALCDLRLTLACHRIAALCVMPLHADFGVEIAGTMWIVFSVFSKIRITMGFAQLTHSSSLITCPLLLCFSDLINRRSLSFS